MNYNNQTIHKKQCVMNELQQALDKIHSADTLIIGASNGLSISEGIHIFGSNQDFYDHFGDFAQKFGFNNIIRGCFYPFRQPENYWAYFARLYHYMNIKRPVTAVMNDLYQLVQDKNYFVVTSNFDNHFRLAGFDENHLFEIEGVGKDLECQTCQSVFDGTDILTQLAQIENGAIATSDIPKCQECGGELKIHVQLDEHFVFDKTWQQKRHTYQDILAQGKYGNTVLLELGVGIRNQLIKQPFMQYTYQNPNAFYISVNKGELWIPDEIANRSVSINGDLASVIHDWAIR